ncbi:MAG: flagellar hook-associated protein FlgL [Oligoflexales bacterium]
MRVSERMRYDTAISRVEKSKDRNLKSLDVLSSQKRINKLRDDAVGASQAIQVKDAIAELESFEKNIDFSNGFLQTTESALSQMSDRLIRAQELAIAMSNDSYGPEARQATSRELNEITQEVVRLGNASFGGRYVFSGFRSSTPPISDDGSYMGDDGVIYLQVENGVFQKINLPGRQVFQVDEDEQSQGHGNMLDMLQVLKEGMEQNDKHSMYTGIEEMKFHLNRLTSLQASVGAVSNALESAQRRVEFDKEAKTSRLSDLEDADVYEATSEFKRTESVLQSTLLAANKLLQPSLLNFLQ